MHVEVCLRFYPQCQYFSMDMVHKWYISSCSRLGVINTSSYYLLSLLMMVFMTIQAVAILYVV